MDAVPHSTSLLLPVIDKVNKQHDILRLNDYLEVHHISNYSNSLGMLFALEVQADVTYLLNIFKHSSTKHFDKPCIKPENQTSDYPKLST